MIHEEEHSRRDVLKKLALAGALVPPATSLAVAGMGRPIPTTTSASDVTPDEAALVHAFRPLKPSLRGALRASRRVSLVEKGKAPPPWRSSNVAENSRDGAGTIVDGHRRYP